MTNRKAYGLFIFIFLVVTISIGGIKVSSAMANPDDSVNIDSDLESDGMVVNYYFDEPQLSVSEDITYVKFDGLDSFYNPGEPILPFKNSKLVIPSGETLASFDINYGNKIFLGVGEAEIAQEPVPLVDEDNYEAFGFEEMPKFEYKEYSLSGTYPRDKNISSLGKMKGFQIFGINIFPVEYNSGTKEFFYYPEITLTLNFESEKEVNTLRAQQMETTSITKSKTNAQKQDALDVVSLVDNPEFVESEIIGSLSVLKNSYSNYELESSLDMPDSPVSLDTEEDYYYIIITNGSLNSCSGDNFQSLIDSKKNRTINNITAKIVLIEDILLNPDYECGGVYGDACYTNSSGYVFFNDTQAKIRNFIRYAYSVLGTRYVLLGGDVSIIPARSFYVNLDRGLSIGGQTIPSDVYYANLDGNMNANLDSYWSQTNYNADFYSEVYVGRAPLETCQQLNNFVSKNLLYESLKNNSGTKRNYFLNTLNVYDSSVTTLSIVYSYFISNSFNTTHAPYGTYSYNTWIPTYLNNNYLNPPSIINHAGHGDFSGIGGYNSLSALNSVKNIYPNFFYSQACFPGAFDVSDSLGEQLVYSYNNSYAVIMNSRYGWYSPSDENAYSGGFMNQFWDDVFYNNYVNLGKANQLSKETEFRSYPFFAFKYGLWTYYSLNLLGDPEISIYIYPNTHLDAIFKSPRSDYYYNNDTVLVDIDCINCTDSWWFNESGSLNYSYPKNFTFPSGNNTIYVYANDIYSNIISKNISFFIDLELPNISINNVSGEFRRQTNVTFDFNCSDNYGISEKVIESDLSGEYTNYSLVNSTNNDYNEYGYDFIITSNSSNFSYRFYTTDYAGNTNSTDWTSVNIENSAPVFNVSYNSRSFFISSNDSLNKTLLFSDIDPQVLNVSAVDSLNLNFAEDDNSINISAINDSVRSGWIYIMANDSIGVTYANISVMMRPPTWVDMGSLFGGPETTNISTLSSFLNVPINLSSDYGIISFPLVNLTQEELNISNNIIFTASRIDLNSSALPIFNVPATISVYNITFTNATIHKNGNATACFDCSFVSHNHSSGVFVFGVTGFSYYEITEATYYDGVQNCYDGKCESGIDCGGSSPIGCNYVALSTSSGGGGGSSGGGGFVKTISKNYSLISTNDVNVSNFSMGVNDSVLVYIDNALHIFNLKNVSNSSILFSLDNIHFFSININTTYEIDLNSDNVNDVEIYYQNYSNKKANTYFTYKKTSFIGDSSFEKTDSVFGIYELTFSSYLDYIKNFVLENTFPLVICILLMAIVYFSIFLILENRRLERHLQKRRF